MRILLKEEEVHRFLPQDQPILMVDTLYENGEDDSTITGLTIKPNTIFEMEGKMNYPGIIEHMAQSCALKEVANALINNDKEEGKSSEIGFIGSIKSFSYLRLPSIGEHMVTKIDLIHKLGQAMIVKAKTYVDEELIAEGELTIFNGQ